MARTSLVRHGSHLPHVSDSSQAVPLRADIARSVPVAVMVGARGAPAGGDLRVEIGHEIAFQASIGIQ